MDKTGIEDLNVDFNKFIIDINCDTDIGCSGQRFVDAHEASKTKAAQDQTTIVFNKMMNAFARNMMGAGADEAINRKRREAQAMCNCNTNPDVTREGPRGVIDMATSYSPEKQYTENLTSGLDAIEVCEEDVSIPSPYGNGAAAGIPQPIITTGLIAFLYIFLS